jgi:hypothetical protein
LEKLANAFELDPAELVSITPTESEPSHGIENDGVVVDDNLESLPPPMQSLYKLLVEQYEKLHGGLVTSSNNDFIGKIANDIEKGIDLIDVKHMTVVEVKRAAIDVVRNITAAH